MSWFRRGLVSFILIGGGYLLAQKPVIYPNGVVNAVSGLGSVDGEALLVGGAIFSVLGENLAVSEQSATGLPLPTSLGGTSLTVDGVAVPLFYVSPGRINFQVPYGVGPTFNGNIFVGGRVGERLPVVVRTSEGASEPVLAFVQDSAPALLAQTGGVCGQGLVLQAAADGSLTYNSPSNSASSGSMITVFANGLGPFYSPPADGHPAVTRPLTQLDPRIVVLGIQGFSLDRDSAGWGTYLAPGSIGAPSVVQRLGNDAMEGCAVPARLSSRWGWSPPVTISIRKGGGQCQDAPSARFANLMWQKSVTTSSESPAGVEEARFAASFASAPENLVTPLPDQPDPPFGGCRCTSGTAGVPVYPVRASNYRGQCLSLGLTALDAGTLTLQGVPGDELTVALSDFNGQDNYTAPLPAGSMEGGTIRVTGGGGADVGDFETETTLPPPIQITTPLAPGTVIDFYRPFVVNWKGGQPETLVQVQLIDRSPISSVNDRACICPVVATAGTAKLDMTYPPGESPILAIGRRSENAEVVVTVTPFRSAVTRFTAPGLTRQARHDWSYEFRFKGLKIR